MKPSFILIASLALFGCSLTWAVAKASKKINFSGTWVLDKSKVDQAASTQRGGGGAAGRGGRGAGRTGRIPGGRNPGDGRPGAGAQLIDSALVIDQTDSELKVTHKIKNSDVPGREFVQSFKLDGSESVNTAAPGGGEFKSRTSWDKNKLVTLGTQQPSASNDAARLDVVIKQEFSLSKDGKTLTVKTSRTMARGQVTTTETFTRQTDTAKY